MDYAKTYRPTHNSWRAMRERCMNANHIWYPIYGGKGIKVSVEWDHFINFLNDMGVRPEGMTLDRKNCNKDYSKDNCRWATDEVQNNNKTTNRCFRYKGVEYTVAEAARKFNVNAKRLLKRLNRNRSIEEALFGKQPIPDWVTEGC